MEVGGRRRFVQFEVPVEMPKEDLLVGETEAEVSCKYGISAQGVGAVVKVHVRGPAMRQRQSPQYCSSSCFERWPHFGVV